MHRTGCDAIRHLPCRVAASATQGCSLRYSMWAGSRVRHPRMGLDGKEEEEKEEEEEREGEGGEGGESRQAIIRRLRRGVARDDDDDDADGTHTPHPLYLWPCALRLWPCALRLWPCALRLWPCVHHGYIRHAHPAPVVIPRQRLPRAARPRSRRRREGEPPPFAADSAGGARREPGGGRRDAPRGRTCGRASGRGVVSTRAAKLQEVLSRVPIFGGGGLSSSPGVKCVEHGVELMCICPFWHTLQVHPPLGQVKRTSPGPYQVKYNIH